MSMHEKKCYPSDMVVTQSQDEMELKSLLGHTASWNFESGKIVLNSIPAHLYISDL